MTDELLNIVRENGPVVIDFYDECLHWRPLDYGTWTPLSSPVPATPKMPTVDQVCDYVEAQLATPARGEGEAACASPASRP